MGGFFGGGNVSVVSSQGNAYDFSNTVATNVVTALSIPGTLLAPGSLLKSHSSFFLDGSGPATDMQVIVAFGAVSGTFPIDTFNSTVPAPNIGYTLFVDQTFFSIVSALDGLNYVAYDTEIRLLLDNSDSLGYPFASENYHVASTALAVEPDISFSNVNDLLISVQFGTASPNIGIIQTAAYVLKLT